MEPAPRHENMAMLQAQLQDQGHGGLAHALESAATSTAELQRLHGELAEMEARNRELQESMERSSQEALVYVLNVGSGKLSCNFKN